MFNPLMQISTVSENQTESDSLKNSAVRNIILTQPEHTIILHRFVFLPELITSAMYSTWTRTTIPDIFVTAKLMTSMKNILHLSSAETILL